MKAKKALKDLEETVTALSKDLKSLSKSLSRACEKSSVALNHQIAEIRGRIEIIEKSLKGPKALD